MESPDKLRSVFVDSLDHRMSSTLPRRENGAYDGTDSECEIETLEMFYGESTSSKSNVFKTHKLWIYLCKIILIIYS
jgi:hypothetical protein